MDSSIEGDYGEKENEISYIYDMKSSLSQLKYMYFHNPIFSKNNLNKNKNIIFELFYRTLMSINKETYERNIISSIYSGLTVSHGSTTL